MKTNTTKTSPTPSVVSTSSAAVGSGFTLGLDLGDRQHHVCVIDVAGNIVREASLPNTRPALAQLLVDFPQATVALEAGTHSPWISRYLTDFGATVLVANPRKLHAISRNERKCDRRDAQMLARLARVDAALLHPIKHGSAQAQHDLLGLKLRDALVRNRVSLINAIRFTLNCTTNKYVNPATHQAVPGGCDPKNGPPMGTRVRLKSDYDISQLSESAQVVLRGMKKYGMILADNGSNFYFQGEANSGWTDDDIEPLKGVPANAFEVISMPPLMP